MSLTSVVAIFLRKIFPLFQCLVSRIGRLFSFRRKTQNIGELPFTVPRTERADFGGSLPAQTGSWDDGWQNTASFHEETVSSKIEEYRRKRAEELRRSEQSASGEPDFFDDMQPTIKAEKTVLFKNDARQAPRTNQPRNLFALKEEDSVGVPQSATAELGELNFDSHDAKPSDTEAWDTEIDLDEVHSALEDQKRRDREDKHRQRREEHERRMREKRQAALS